LPVERAATMNDAVDAARHPRATQRRRRVIATMFQLRCFDQAPRRVFRAAVAHVAAGAGVVKPPIRRVVVRRVASPAAALRARAVAAEAGAAQHQGQRPRGLVLDHRLAHEDARR
jgi:hypothetical protein